MADSRAFMPLTDKFVSNLAVPRSPSLLVDVGQEAPDFVLPCARYREDPVTNKATVAYGEQIQLSALRGRRVVLSLTRIVSDRFF